jgi:uncharacterized protein (DUF433 family)
MSTSVQTVEAVCLPTPGTLSRYVTRDPQILQGEPIVAGTQVAVRDIVLLWQSGMKPEQIAQELYDLVTTAQVFDTLSYYLDYPQDVDEWIAWYAARPFLNVPATLRLSPLWDDVMENIAVYRQELDAELESVEW